MRGLKEYRIMSCQLTFVFIFFSVISIAQELPEGFQIETIVDDVELPAGMVHVEELSYIWELSGLVWPVIDGDKINEPLLDIQEEVGLWNDHGLLSVALHPNFDDNGYIFLLYVVDRNHLLFSGTSTYNPDENIYEEATIGRLTRYTVNPENKTEIIEGSRRVLIGETKENGIPITTISHGVGTILFGTDGSLLISTGDSNSPGSDYNGSGEVPPLAYDVQALEDGILKPDENVGAFRSQYLNSLCGKVLRVNPEDGSAYESNPFYNSEQPDAPISKVWALGLRNPFRMSLIPETGSTDPELGDPGSIIIGDVGDWTWEEVNIISNGGMNFGWPIFQGPESYYLFDINFTEDPLNPIDVPCTGSSNYTFQELIVPPRANHDEQWEHPCGGLIPENVRTFVHERPVLAYCNTIFASSEQAYDDSVAIPSFNPDGSASWVGITSEGSEVIGAKDFTGSSSIAGVFYTGDAFPEEYSDIYLQADFAGWFKAFRFNEFLEIIEIQDWSNSIGNVVHISENPFDGAIYLSSLFPGEIKRLTFAGNLAPVIEVTPDTIFGTGPLTVDFDASGTFDPEGDSMSFLWDFGNGTTATGPFAQYSFGSNNNEANSYIVELTVTDSNGNSNSQDILVSINNSPPQAEIISFSEDYKYSIKNPTALELKASISDSESSLNDLYVKWEVFLHHNTHFHLERTYEEFSPTHSIYPLGCGIEAFWYRIVLTVKDPQGLTTKKTREIFPDCDGTGGFNEDVFIFPNPTRGRITINYPAPTQGDLQFYLFDVSGNLLQEVNHTTLPGETSRVISVNTLPSGLYLIKVESATWSRIQKLAIINN